MPAMREPIARPLRVYSALPLGDGAVKWYWLAILLSLAVWAAFPATAGAQDRQVMISTDGPFPLLIDGEQVTKFPHETLPGSQACALTITGYLNDLERLVFDGWSHGPTDACVTFFAPGEYIALYTHQVLLQVRSEVRAYRISSWVPKNELTELEVL